MKKILMIIGGIVVGIIILVIIIFAITSATSKKLVCKSKEGDITIMYNKKTITGYITKGLTFDLDVAKQRVEKVGLEVYLDEVETWFSENTTGTCNR